MEEPSDPRYDDANRHRDPYRPYPDRYALTPEELEAAPSLPDLIKLIESPDAMVSPQVSYYGVFISYRRSDQPALAGRIYDRLEQKFGPRQVFMDVASIAVGRDFVEALDESLTHCKALIVVIGKDWLTATDVSGDRRIDNPDDYVRLEIETALRRNILAIPLLIDGTPMPHAVDLPGDMKPLARRNGLDISNARFRTDCLELISTLEHVLAR
jgi:hypothetical protein